MHIIVNRLLTALLKMQLYLAEGKAYHGLAAIKEWNETISKQLELTLEIISAIEKNGETIVTALASGKFDGSPVFRWIFISQLKTKRSLPFVLNRQVNEAWVPPK